MSLFDGAIKIAYGVAANLNAAALPAPVEPEVRKPTPITSPDYVTECTPTERGSAVADTFVDLNSFADLEGPVFNPESDSDTLVPVNHEPDPSDELQMTPIEPSVFERMGIKAPEMLNDEIRVALLGNLKDWQNAIAESGPACPVRLDENGQVLWIRFTIPWQCHPWERGIQTPDGNIALEPTPELKALSGKITDELNSVVFNATSPKEKVARVEELNALLHKNRFRSAEEILVELKAHRGELENQKKSNLNGIS